MPRFNTIEELVEDILSDRVFTDERTGCWIWRPGQWNTGNGYGKVRFGGVGYVVHRLVYTVKVGDIPDGMVVHHRCERRACCNPDHLEAVTPARNTYLGRAILFSRTKEEPRYE